MRALAFVLLIALAGTLALGSPLSARAQAVPHLVVPRDPPPQVAVPQQPAASEGAAAQADPADAPPATPGPSPFPSTDPGTSPNPGQTTPPIPVDPVNKKTCYDLASSPNSNLGILFDLNRLFQAIYDIITLQQFSMQVATKFGKLAVGLLVVLWGLSFFPLIKEIRQAVGARAARMLWEAPAFKIVSLIGTVFIISALSGIGGNGVSSGTLAQSLPDAGQVLVNNVANLTGQSKVFSGLSINQSKYQIEPVPSGTCGTNAPTSCVGGAGGLAVVSVCSWAKWFTLNNSFSSEIANQMKWGFFDSLASWAAMAMLFLFTFVAQLVIFISLILLFLKKVLLGINAGFVSAIGLVSLGFLGHDKTKSYGEAYYKKLVNLYVGGIALGIAIFFCVNIFGIEQVEIMTSLAPMANQFPGIGPWSLMGVYIMLIYFFAALALAVSFSTERLTGDLLNGQLGLSGKELVGGLASTLALAAGAGALAKAGLGAMMKKNVIASADAAGVGGDAGSGFGSDPSSPSQLGPIVPSDLGDPTKRQTPSDVAPLSRGDEANAGSAAPVAPNDVTPEGARTQQAIADAQRRLPEGDQGTDIGDRLRHAGKLAASGDLSLAEEALQHAKTDTENFASSANDEATAQAFAGSASAIASAQAALQAQRAAVPPPEASVIKPATDVQPGDDATTPPPSTPLGEVPQDNPLGDVARDPGAVPPAPTSDAAPADTEATPPVADDHAEAATYAVPAVQALANFRDRMMEPYRKTAFAGTMRKVQNVGGKVIGVSKRVIGKTADAAINNSLSRHAAAILHEGVHGGSTSMGHHFGQGAFAQMPRVPISWADASIGANAGAIATTEAARSQRSLADAFRPASTRDESTPSFTMAPFPAGSPAKAAQQISAMIQHGHTAQDNGDEGGAAVHFAAAATMAHAAVALPRVEKDQVPVFADTASRLRYASTQLGGYRSVGPASAALSGMPIKAVPKIRAAFVPPNTRDALAESLQAVVRLAPTGVNPQAARAGAMLDAAIRGLASNTANNGDLRTMLTQTRLAMMDAARDDKPNAAVWTDLAASIAPLVGAVEITSPPAPTIDETLVGV